MQSLHNPSQGDTQGVSSVGHAESRTTGTGRREPKWAKVILPFDVGCAVRGSTVMASWVANDSACFWIKAIPVRTAPKLAKSAVPSSNQTRICQSVHKMSNKTAGKLCTVLLKKDDDEDSAGTIFSMSWITIAPTKTPWNSEAANPTPALLNQNAFCYILQIIPIIPPDI
jgi:hypothetical protein